MYAICLSQAFPLHQEVAINNFDMLFIIFKLLSRNRFIEWPIFNKIMPISKNENEILSLKKEIRRLKSVTARAKILQEKKDQLEQAFKNSQITYQAVFEQSSLGNKLINEHLQIIKVNKALLKLLGYSKKDLVGRRITDFAHPDFVPSWKELQRELWANEKPSFSIDTCIIKKNKNIIWCHVTSILVMDKGKKIGYTIIEDISKRKELESNLKDANEREHLFQQQLLEVTINTQENERSRIAEDLHNSLGQLLYGVKLSLDRIEFENQDKNASAIKTSKDILSECIRESRRISYDLMPKVLEDFGLIEAIQDISRQLSGKITFGYHFTGLRSRLPKYLEIAIYRIVQELTINIVKHANATKAGITLGIKKNDIKIRVEDNGTGFNVLEGREPGIGMRAIKNKLNLLKGNLDVSSMPGQGTIVNIQIPHKNFNQKNYQ